MFYYRIREEGVPEAEGEFDFGPCSSYNEAVEKLLGFENNLLMEHEVPWDGTDVREVVSHEDEKTKSMQTMFQIKESSIVLWIYKTKD